jgi:hypothetical protein
MNEFHPNQLARSGFQAANVFQRRSDPRLHLVAGAPVEVHDKGVLGRVAVKG